MMSTTLQILVQTVPPRNADAYAFARTLAVAVQDLPPAPRLVQLHDALIARYPCWSSGAYEESGRANCPWTATPLISCFQGDMGIIGIDSPNPDLVPFVLRRAGALALTVIDEQAGKVYRPATFSVVFRGIQKNVNLQAMVSKLMPLLKMGREQVLRAIGTPNVMLKCRLDYVTAKRFASTMDLLGCDCTVEKELLVSAEGVSTVMGFPSDEVAEAAPVAARITAPAPVRAPAPAPVPAQASASVSAPASAPAPAPAEVAVPARASAATTAAAAMPLPATPLAPATAAQDASPSAGAPQAAPRPEPAPQRTAADTLGAPQDPNAGMARFLMDEPERQPRLDLSLAPSWLARIFGKLVAR